MGGYGAVLEGVELWGRVCNCIGGSETVGEGMELAELHTYMICLWEVKLLGRVLIVELL